MISRRGAEAEPRQDDATEPAAVLQQHGNDKDETPEPENYLTAGYVTYAELDSGTKWLLEQNLAPEDPFVHYKFDTNGFEKDGIFAKSKKPFQQYASHHRVSTIRGQNCLSGVVYNTLKREAEKAHLFGGENYIDVSGDGGVLYLDSPTDGLEMGIYTKQAFHTNDIGFRENHEQHPGDLCPMDGKGNVVPAPFLKLTSAPGKEMRIKGKVVPDSMVLIGRLAMIFDSILYHDKNGDITTVKKLYKAVTKDHWLTSNEVHILAKGAKAYKEKYGLRTIFDYFSALKPAPSGSAPAKRPPFAPNSRNSAHYATAAPGTNNASTTSDGTPPHELRRKLKECAQKLKLAEVENNHLQGENAHLRGHTSDLAGSISKKVDADFMNAETRKGKLALEQRRQEDQNAIWNRMLDGTEKKDETINALALRRGGAAGMAEESDAADALPSPRSKSLPRSMKKARAAMKVVPGDESSEEEEETTKIAKARSIEPKRKRVDRAALIGQAKAAMITTPAKSAAKKPVAKSTAKSKSAQKVADDIALEAYKQKLGIAKKSSATRSTKKTYGLKIGKAVSIIDGDHEGKDGVISERFNPNATKWIVVLVEGSDEKIDVDHLTWEV